MIPPLAPPASDEARARLADTVTNAHRDYAEPPAPVRGLERADTVLTGRNTWTQATPVELTQVTATEPDVQGYIADQAAATPNPLRELIAELSRFADQLDTQGIVPLGIHTCTVHNYSPGGYYRDERRVAQVVTTVRGVRREWIDQHRTPDQPTEPAPVPPTQCACYGWTEATPRATWGVEHHPRCDGTGHHKAEQA